MEFAWLRLITDTFASASLDSWGRIAKVSNICEENVMFTLFYIKISDESQCKENKCTNGATCVDENGSYICLCSDKFIGTYCQSM